MVENSFIKLATNFELLREAWAKVINKEYDFNDQKLICEIYNYLSDKKYITEVIISGLSRELKRDQLIENVLYIMNSYEKHQSLFEDIFIFELFDLECQFEEKEHSLQLKKVCKLEREIKDNSNSADYAFFKGDGTYDSLMSKDEKLYKELYIERNKLNEKDLILKRKKDSIVPYRKIVFSDIVKLCEYYKKIINKYKDKTTKRENNHIYITYSLINYLYEKCNNHIFVVDSLSIVDNTFNLKDNNGFKIKKGVRFQSLIWLLQNSLNNNPEWDKSILKLVGIDYDLKYVKNRNKYIDNDTLKSSKIDLKTKIDHIINTKVDIKYYR